MNAYKVVLTIINMDNVDAEEVKEIIENQRYPNRCISPIVHSIESADIGKWSDDHPLNNTLKSDSEWLKIFPSLKES